MLEQALEQNAAQLTVSEKRELLGRLLSRLAHEIRNPLSSLDIHVQLLEEDLGGIAPALRAQLTPRLDIIHGELHRLKRIAENFLRLAGPSTVDLEPIDIVPLVHHVRQLLEPEAAARNIEIITRVQADELPRVVADPVRLTQALLNLLINSLQAVDRQGRVQVSVGTATGNLVITVEDNGPGIPPDRLAAIFDPYFTTKSEGTGLGLWIAEQIVAAHGGRLTARNAPERGAVFTLTLPLSRSVGTPEIPIHQAQV